MTFAFFAAHGVGVERIRRLHRGQRQQLEQMIGHHVAQRAGRFVELPRRSTPIVSATVICTWSICSRFQIGSKIRWRSAAP